MMWPPPCSCHDPGHQLHADHRPLQIDVDHEINVLDGLVQEKTEPAAAGDVEEVVDSTEGLERVVDEHLPVLHRAHVQAVQSNPVAGYKSVPQARLVDIGQGQPVRVAAPHQHTGEMLADPAGCAGHDGDFWSHGLSRFAVWCRTETL